MFLVNFVLRNGTSWSVGELYVCASFVKLLSLWGRMVAWGQMVGGGGGNMHVLQSVIIAGMLCRTHGSAHCSWSRYFLLLVHNYIGHEKASNDTLAPRPAPPLPPVFAWPLPDP